MSKTEFVLQVFSTEKVWRDASEEASTTYTELAVAQERLERYRAYAKQYGAAAKYRLVERTTTWKDVVLK